MPPGVSAIKFKLIAAQVRSAASARIDQGRATSAAAARLCLTALFLVASASPGRGGAIQESGLDSVTYNRVLLYVTAKKGFCYQGLGGSWTRCILKWIRQQAKWTRLKILYGLLAIEVYL